MGVKVREKIKGSGVWWIFIDHQGHRKSQKIGTKKVAKQVKLRIEAEIANRNFNLETNAPNFKPVADEWLDIIIGPTCSSTTYTRYNGILKNQILPDFKSRKIDSITRGEVKSLLLGIKADGYSRSQV